MSNNESLVYGQLNQATFTDFVSRLTVEQSGNRPHATANPLFSVQNEKIVWSYDSECTYSLLRIFFRADDHSSFDNYEAVLAKISNVQDYEKVDIFTAYIDENNISTSNLEDIAEAINTVFDEEYEACVMYGHHEWEHISTHITQEAAHAFIERNKHDYRKLRVYAVSAYWCWEMKAIMDGLVNGSIQYVDRANSDTITELERQRNVVQNLLAQYAGQAVNEPDVQEALLFGLSDTVKPVSHGLKSLKWKECESGGTELMLNNELLAVVSYENRGWCWYLYSMSNDVRLNTPNSNTAFNDMESAQTHCENYISNRQF